MSVGSTRKERSVIMSRKILSILMLIVIVLPLLVACNTTGSETTEPASVTPTVDVTSQKTPEATLTPTPTPTPEEPLPSSSTLVGSVYMPPIDNQGNIGSCSAESVTYMQFTIAVAQYMNNVVGDKNWKPSTGNKKYIFSPKFTFVYSGAGTGYSYDILVDQGCLPLSKSTFKKSGTASVLNDPMSRKWDVDTSGLMAESLKYRLKSYSEVDFNVFNYDFTTETGKKHIEKIKRYINNGNAVSVCGWSSYWKYTDIENPGTLGKAKDKVIWAGLKEPNSTSDGNHAICLVGYDDEITCRIAGVELKGAFCLANSWGNWCNNGFVWIMYDSFNRVSGHPELAESGFYSQRLAFYSNADAGEARIKAPYNNTTENMQMIFTKTGDSATVEGKDYPVYTIKDRAYENYLGYSTGAVWKKTADADCSFVLVPFEDYSQWNGYKFDENGKFREVSYKDSFLVVAVNKYKSLSSNAFVTAGSSYTSSLGRVVDISAVSTDLVINQAFMICGYKADEESFTSSLKLFNDYTGQKDIERTGTLYRTSFISWDTDVIVDAPNLIIEAEIDSVKREALWVTLYRCDKDGNMVSRTPQVIMNSKTSTSDMDADGGDTRFDGKASDDTFCKGYLAFGYNDLCELGKDYSYDELLWGINITGNMRGVKVKGLKLMTLDGEVIAQLKLNDDEPAMFNGKSRSFILAPSDNITEYSGAAGSTGLLYSQSAGKYVNNTSGAKLSLGGDLNKKSSMRFVGQPDGTTRIFMDNIDGGETWVLDISGKNIEEGTEVKINKNSTTRTTQEWLIQKIGKGTFKIVLASDPTYMVTCNKSTGKLTLTKNYSENCVWTTKSDTTLEFAVKAEKVSDGIKITGKTPEKYTSGDIEVRITAQDGTYYGEALKLTPKNGEFETKVTLPEGTYLFSAYYEGEVYGFEYVLVIK